MTDNIRKVFDLLGIEPNEKFKIDDGFNVFDSTFYMHEDLSIFDNNGERRSFHQLLLNGTYKIIKLPKEPKKKKLRDWTEEDYKKWKDKNCKIDSMCDKCIFKNVVCAEFYSESWVNNKDLYSDKFLNQEIEVE